MDKSVLDKLSQVLIVVGGLNWGLIGFFDYNLVEKLFKVDSTLTTIVYDLVGLAALWAFYGMVKMMSSGKAE